ncbi:MAG: fatty acid-binding protein DegV [Epulopiscium sp. Nele67-Bin005]|nr:MAG: fatty acid-binding protein DegV [Epulopiscium sp. Nele67-Bin005]
MSKSIVLTDSACDLSPQTLKDFNIVQVPLKIIYKDREYEEKVEISSKEMFAKLKEEVPTTSLPSNETVAKAISKIIEQGYTDILVVNISTALSGTLNSIRLVAEDFQDKINFHYFDTKTLGYPEGVIVTEVARCVKEGLSVEEIKQKYPSIMARTKGFINVDTLEFLIKGGRLSKAAGAIGTLLNLKPIVTYNEQGELYTYSKPRGRKQANKQLKEVLKEDLAKGPCRVWILSGDADELAQSFYDEIMDLENIESIHLEEIGASMGIHTGPNTLGLVYLSLE